MQSLPHTTDSEQFRRHVADLYGERDTIPTASPAPDWPQAVAQVEAALCTKLRLDVPPERIRKALDLVLAHAVTLHDDGTASVQSGQQTYTLAPHCPCQDAKQRNELCKHTIAVDLHRRAAKRCSGTATAPATPGSVPETPSSAPPPASVSGTAAWPVQEAPTSACFKWRVGSAELTYTFRGVTDDEVLERMRETLPLLQNILAACETRADARAKERVAMQTDAQAPPAPQASAPPDMAALIQHAVQQAVQHALAAPRHGHTAANGSAAVHGSSSGSAKRSAKSRDQDSGWCSLHSVTMDFHDNERGTWYSHPLDNGRYCKGAK